MKKEKSYYEMSVHRCGMNTVQIRYESGMKIIKAIKAIKATKIKTNEKRKNT